jgi:hypothetical protein
MKEVSLVFIMTGKLLKLSYFHIVLNFFMTSYTQKWLIKMIFMVIYCGINYNDINFPSSGVKAFLHTQGHMTLFMLVVYLACTRTSKFLPFLCTTHRDSW